MVHGAGAGSDGERSVAGLGRPRRWDRDPRVAEPVASNLVLFTLVGGFQPEWVAGNGPGHAESIVGAGRATSAPPIKPMDPERPRALTGLVGQSMAQKRTKPLELTPLSSPMSPLSSPLTQASAAEPARDTGRTPTPALTSNAPARHARLPD